MTTTPKTIGDCQMDAVKLHALAQGLEELVNLADAETHNKAAQNAVFVQAQIVVEKADQLATALDKAETHERKAKQ